MQFEASIGDKQYRVELKQVGDARDYWLDGCRLALDVARISPGRLSILLEGKSYEVRRGTNGHVLVSDTDYDVRVVDARSWRSKHTGGAGGGTLKLVASMPGRVLRLLAQEGDKITAGQGVAVVEAMKMQNEVRSPREGVLRKLLIQEGANVIAGETLAIIE
jgi:biotin carboxyl carrier protein